MVGFVAYLDRRNINVEGKTCNKGERANHAQESATGVRKTCRGQCQPMRYATVKFSSRIDKGAGEEAREGSISLLALRQCLRARSEAVRQHV